MPSPFPGMDPYLEHPALWPGVHLSLIVALQSALGPKLRPKYYVAIEERVYVAEPADGELLGVPDAIVIGARPRSDSPNGAGGYPSSPSGDGHEQEEQRPGVLTVELPIPDRVREAYLEVRVPASHEVVTVVELLSPSNKRPGEGRQQYEAKRAKTLNSFTSFVEVDLLRAGEAMPVWLHGCPVTRGLPGDYRILVSRGHQRPRAHLYPFGVRDPIPVFPLPLRSDDAEPSVDLQALLNQVYDRASYDLRIDYRGAPVPPLQEEALWADELLGQQGLR